VRIALALAALLAGCSGGSETGNSSPPRQAKTAKSSCSLDAGRFGEAPLQASEPDAFKNVLAVGRDGPSWNGVAITWRQAKMYVVLLPQMSPRPTLHVQLDPKADCDTIDLLRDAVHRHCTARYCSIERVTVPASGPRPLEF
jgi:hypothetical protein